MAGCILGLLLMLALPFGVALAQDSGQEPRYDEAEALAIDRMLICPVCPAETIDQAQVEISRQMRDVVRQLLAEGASREEILDFFVDRYGAQVLAAPPKSGVNLLAWLLPIVGILVGIGGVFFVIRAMASRSGERTDAGPAWEEGLEPYLEAVDNDLALSYGEERRGVNPAPDNRPPTPGQSGAGASDRDSRGPEERREERREDDGKTD